MCPEYLYYPPVGQNHPTQSLFYNKVSGISCNLLSTVLEVKSKIVVRVQNGCRYIGWYPCDWVANSEPQLTAPAQCHLGVWHHTLLAQEKDRNSKLLSLVSTECASLSHHCRGKRWMSRTIINWGLSVYNVHILSNMEHGMRSLPKMEKLYSLKRPSTLQG